MLNEEMTTDKWFKLRRKHVALVQFIIEGYEGMATVTTIDPQKAIIRISIMQDYIQEVSSLLDDLKYKYNLEEIIGYPIT
jgi:hypothetical protein